MIKPCSALEYYNRTVHADSEEDLDFLMVLLNPVERRDEMGDIYSDILGYNPLNYYDEKFLGNAYTAIAEIAPEAIKDELNYKRDDIIEALLDQKSSDIEEYLMTSLIDRIRKEFRWNVPVDELANSSVFDYLTDFERATKFKLDNADFEDDEDDLEYEDDDDDDSDFDDD